MSIILYGLILGFLTVAAQDQDEPVARNEVIGEPFVNCAADAIYVKLRTLTTFHGHVDVKFTPDKSCFQSLVTNNQIEILIPHEECMVPRRRSYRPSGVIIESSLAVSFHPKFTTSDDRIFNLSCFHQKHHNGSTIAVGTPKPPPPDGSAPSCNYEVLAFPDGPPASRLALGQPVYHSWKCTNIRNMCMSVENCQLVGGDQMHTIIDSNGCSTDLEIIPELDYENETSAGVSLRVFGVTNSPIVYFSCQVRLQTKSGKDCRAQAPQCKEEDAIAARRRRSVEDEKIEVRTQNLEISQLDNIAAPNCTVSPQDEVHEIISEAHGIESEQVCANFQTLLIVTLILTLACIVLTTLIVLLIIRRQKYEIASMS